MSYRDFAHCFGCGEPIVIEPVVTMYDPETQDAPAVAGRVCVGMFHRYCLPDCSEDWYDVVPVHGIDATVRHVSSKQWCDAATALRLQWALQEAEAITRRLAEARRLLDADRRLCEGSAAARRISTALRSRVMERDQFRCRRCGAGAPDVKIVVDHIFPVSLGGGSGQFNLQTLCSECNKGKGVKPPTPHDLAVTMAGL